MEEYKIKPGNRYNMDEKGDLMGCIGKVRVIVSKYDKTAFMTENPEVENGSHLSNLCLLMNIG